MRTHTTLYQSAFLKKLLVNIKKLPSFFIPNMKVAIDVGTASTRIGIYDKGIVLRQASYVGFNTKSAEYIFYGNEARQIFGKSPKFINVIKPIHHSIISDFDATVALCKFFYTQSIEPFVKEKPLARHNMTAISAVPTSATEVEQRAMHEALLQVGFKHVIIVEKPIAAGLGVGLPVFSNKPSFIIDMGAGSVEIAILISGGIVASRTVSNAGDYMDKLIKNYLHLKYAIIIGDQTAQRLKTDLFDLREQKKIVTIRGKSLENGLPKSVRVTSADIREALSNSLNHIIDIIKEVIESAPPEIVDNIIRDGIAVTGGLAQIPGLDRFMATDLKVPIVIARDPANSTVNGLLQLVAKPEWLDLASLRI